MSERGETAEISDLVLRLAARKGVYKYRRQIGSQELLAEALKHEGDPEPPSARELKKAEKAEKAGQEIPKRPAQPFEGKPADRPPRWLTKKIKRK